MTEEEQLKQEAEKYVKQNYCEVCVMADDCKCGCIDCFTVQAYIAGAESKKMELSDMTGIASHQQSSNMQRHFTIRELEKENARLKEINTHTLSQLNLDNGELITQLTKAKELLKKVLDLKKVVTKAEEYLLLEEAEQFLKETK